MANQKLTFFVGVGGGGGALVVVGVGGCVTGFAVVGG